MVRKDSNALPKSLPAPNNFIIINLLEDRLPLCYKAFEEAAYESTFYCAVGLYKAQIQFCNCKFFGCRQQYVQI